MHIALIPLLLSMTVNVAYRFAATHRELTESNIYLEKYQKQLRALAADLSLTEERERRRLASDLHDSISQSLALSIMDLSSWRQHESLEEYRDKIKPLCDRLNQTLQTARTLTFDLCPTTLYQLGLEDAIEELTEDFSKQHGIPVQFQDDQQPKLISNDNRYFLYRAARELLYNIAKYAQAKNVSVAVTREEENIAIRVSDDGIGFDPSSLKKYSAQKSGYGLFSIQERLKQLEGNLDIQSEPGHGTAITIFAPLDDGETETKGECG